MEGDRERWDDRYLGDDFELPDGPSDWLREHAARFPSGPALDVATGSGRNALFLAAQGYEVDAIDVSGAGLALARERAREREVSVNWIQADIDSYPFPPQTYAVITVVLYDARDRMDALKDALVPGGVLVYDHLLRGPDKDDRGPPPRYRFERGELRKRCSDLTIVAYAEETGVDRPRVKLLGRRD